jgi:hypothetical protein
VPARRRHSASVRAEIRAKYWSGVTQVTLSAEYAVSQSTISRIVAVLDLHGDSPRHDTHAPSPPPA